MHAVSETNEITQLSIRAGALLTVSPSESAGVLNVYEAANVNARQSIILGTPARVLEISSVDMGSSSAKLFDVVLNAVNDAAADAALAAAGSRIPIPLGKAFNQVVQGSAPLITRIDIKARVAETGANLVMVFAKT